MKIFVTGATGFIGSHLVDRLLQSRHELRCLVRKVSPASAELERRGATICPGDVTDKSSILRGMRGCERVFHLAGVYSFWEPRKEDFRNINVEGTRNVMEAVLEIGASKVLHVSTVGIFGHPAESPFSENTPPGSVRFSEYFETKYQGERIVWDLYSRKKLPVVVVYPAAVLGPGDLKTTGQYIMSLIRRRMPVAAFTDSVLTFVHVRDVVEVICRAAEKPDNIGERYIAGNQRFSFGELNRMVGEISGVPPPRMRLPGFLTMANAAVLTRIANVIKRPPPWGLSVDQIKVMREGFRADGSKAERELCISYTPIRVALEEAIASYRA